MPGVGAAGGFVHHLLGQRGQLEVLVLTQRLEPDAGVRGGAAPAPAPRAT